MRVLVTGANGFVGRWLVAELARNGHLPTALGREGLDVTDAEAVRQIVDSAQPDGIAHLAAVSYAGHAAADPGKALAVTVGGTLNLVEAIRRSKPDACLVVAGSSEVYRPPRP